MTHAGSKTHSDITNQHERAGVCLFVMAAGRLPFEEDRLPQLFRRITRADYTCPPWLSTGLVDVLGLIMEPNPSKR